MQAVILTGHGGYEMLEVRSDWPVPVAGAGEVLVTVGAAAVNNTDINTRIGWYGPGMWTGRSGRFPLIQGADVCGTVVGVGAGVDPARIGERVLVDPVLRGGHPGFLGSERDGGFAQVVAVPGVNAVAISSELSDVELASFPCSYGVAEHMLTRAGVTAGERILVTGASGGVGSAAVQLAGARGATVTAVTTGDKAATVAGLGATTVIERSGLGASSSVDVVIDVVGGEGWPRLLDLLVPGGRYATAGAIAGPIVELDLRTLYLKDLALFGCTMYPPEVFAALVRRVERGEIRPLVAATFPLSRIVEAQQVFLARSHVGKISLVPGS